MYVTKNNPTVRNPFNSVLIIIVILLLLLVVSIIHAFWTVHPIPAHFL